MPFCAYCGAAVNAVSYAACPACGKPTNGATPRAVQSTSGSTTGLVIIVVIVVVLVGMAFLGIIAAIAIPNFLTAFQRANQRRTMTIIHSVGKAVEAYATDHNQYPNAIDVSGLSAQLVPTYIRSVPSLDAWGHSLHYDAWVSQGSTLDSYAIGSGGKDGVFLHESLRDYIAHPGTSQNFNDDIVYSNGAFVQYPEGIQVQ